MTFMMSCQVIKKQLNVHLVACCPDSDLFWTDDQTKYHTTGITIPKDVMHSSPELHHIVVEQKDSDDIDKIAKNVNDRKLWGYF